MLNRWSLQTLGCKEEHRVSQALKIIMFVIPEQGHPGKEGPAGEKGAAVSIFLPSPKINCRSEFQLLTTFQVQCH